MVYPNPLFDVSLNGTDILFHAWLEVGEVFKRNGKGLIVRALCVAFMICSVDNFILKDYWAKKDAKQYIFVGFPKMRSGPK